MDEWELPTYPLGSRAAAGCRMHVLVPKGRAPENAGAGKELASAMDVAKVVISAAGG